MDAHAFGSLARRHSCILVNRPTLHSRRMVSMIHHSSSKWCRESMAVKFNGALYFCHDRDPPSPEILIGAAWTRMAHNVLVGQTRMTQEEMFKAGMTDLRLKIRYPDKIGGGLIGICSLNAWSELAS
ncbi:hypothetical protein BDR05DRAFT_959565 [Suillus weaverae]|nr:hypothetical protein BDR05DRAFT_959565 [Suillus weaverae]